MFTTLIIFLGFVLFMNPPKCTCQVKKETMYFSPWNNSGQRRDPDYYNHDPRRYYDNFQFRQCLQNNGDWFNCNRLYNQFPDYYSHGNNYPMYLTSLY